MFVDEGDVFDEIKQFVEKMTKLWDLDVSVAHNRDVSSKAKKLGDLIKVSQLNEQNQKEIKRLGIAESEFEYWPESFVGNHLMKTVASNTWVVENNIEYLYVGVRWDEQGARGEDDYLRSLEDPKHFRVEPILHISERDVWSIIKKFDIPYVKLYESGFRSLGAKTTTGKVSDIPAWEQDIENTSERAGRAQDKEKIMEKLRALGYM
jgi:phosphoadenosine phosphosulfate reductase